MMIIIGNAINMAINSSKRNTIKPIQAIPIRNKKNNEIIPVTVLSLVWINNTTFKLPNVLLSFKLYPIIEDEKPPTLK